jgi:hypothetical protein
MLQPLYGIGQRLTQLLGRLQIMLQQVVGHASRSAYPNARQTL